MGTGKAVYPFLQGKKGLACEIYYPTIHADAWSKTCLSKKTLRPKTSQESGGCGRESMPE